MRYAPTGLDKQKVSKSPTAKPIINPNEKRSTTNYFLNQFSS
ncbi:hypothetical protein [Avibacterium paragallinarum]|nr:hypothetical protein [Avibacterium paragallinarum]